MKNVGYSDNGTIVEFTHEEWMAFVVLSRAIQGRDLDWIPALRDFKVDGVDFAPTLDAIQKWVVVKDKANALLAIADQIRVALKENK